jgi:5-formyltetrahydrofolate cyclo-ligase
MEPAKEDLRREIKRRLGALDPKQFHEEGLRVAACISSTPYWLSGKLVLLFLSTAIEIDTQPLLERAFSDKKKVFIPKIEDRRIVFYRVFSPAGPWRYGPFSIREPAGDTEALNPGDGSLLVIVPGLAFDKEGNRLGRGKGYYDRFFAELDKENPAYNAVGLCMESQVVPRLPREGWDKKMDALCTGGGLTVFGKKR